MEMGIITNVRNEYYTALIAVKQLKLTSAVKHIFNRCINMLDALKSTVEGSRVLIQVKLSSNRFFLRLFNK